MLVSRVIAAIKVLSALRLHNIVNNGHFPGKPRLASCPFDSQSTAILTLSILTRQAESLHILLLKQAGGACSQST